MNIRCCQWTARTTESVARAQKKTALDGPPHFQSPEQPGRNSAPQPQRTQLASCFWMASMTASLEVAVTVSNRPSLS
jgi:hypothetical protein